MQTFCSGSEDLQIVDFLVQETNWLTNLCAVHPESAIFQTSNPLWCDVILKKGDLFNITTEAKFLNICKDYNIAKVTGLIMTDEILSNGESAAFMAMAEKGVPLHSYLETTNYRCPGLVAHFCKCLICGMLAAAMQIA